MHELFHNQYSYNTYMNSYSDAASLRNAMTYMMKQVKELRASQAPQSDVEKAKTFISDHLAEPHHGAGRGRAHVPERGVFY